MSQVPSAEPMPPAPSPAAAKRAWDDAPLRTKLTLLVLLATVAGSLVGLAEAHLGQRAFVLGPGLCLVVVVLLTLGQRWVCGPVERLADQIERLLRMGRLSAAGPLPVHRTDELGQLSRALLQVATQSLRDHHEAVRLRRTLDHRVEQATRRATRQLEQLAMRDPLTDLGNRRFLQSSLQPLVDSVRDAEEDLVCIAIDMDNFKQVNDKLGHAAGDELLIFVASLIRATIRHDDYAVRLGGDEFVVLMPNCELPRAEQFGRQLTALFQQHTRLVAGVAAQASLSIGVSSLQQDQCADGEALVAAADARLLTAKRQGKSRLVSA